MDEGYIKINRRLTSWEWYQDANTARVFIHCLIMANWKDGRFRGAEVPRGSFVTGRKKLAEELKMSEQSVRTALNHLKSTNEITIKTTPKYSIITVVKYNEYQSDNRQINQQLTNNQPTTNQQLTTYNNVNNVNNVKKYKRDIYKDIQKLVSLGMYEEVEKLKKYVDRYEPNFEEYKKIEDAVFNYSIRNLDAYVEKIMKGNRYES